MFRFRSFYRRPPSDEEVQFVFDFGDGEPLTMADLLQANPDMHIERISDSHTCSKNTRLLVFVIAIIGALIALGLWVSSADMASDAQSVCDHHVTSGLVRHLITRGMGKGFFYGELSSGALYGMLIVWNPSCQRAIAVVVRTGPNGQVFNFVTHYYLSGAKGTNVRSALAYARARVAQEVVQVYSGPPEMAYRAVPRFLGKPGYRSPGSGEPRIGNPGGVGGIGIRRGEQD